MPQAAQDPETPAPSNRGFLRLRAFPLTFLHFVLELGGSKKAQTHDVDYFY